jgi:NADPH-dependent glutamate synthase beta subunit-like oxidoreductase
LSCAHYLSVLGRSSVIFEADTVPGGLLATGIPPFRLPREGLAGTIEEIVSNRSALELETEIRSVGDLTDAGFDFVFLATGAHQGRRLGAPGECSPGVVDALGFLHDYCVGYGETASAHRVTSRSVAVIGGGHTAFDAARAAAADGASAVAVYYRRTIEEMAAYQEEIQAAVADGVRLEPLALPVAFIPGHGGRLGGMRVARMRLGVADEEGRRRAERIEGETVDVECETVIRSIGQTLPDLPVYAGYERSKWGGLAVNMVTGETAQPRVFAGGDCVLGASSVLRAIDSGKRTALAIDARCGGPGTLPLELDLSIKRPFGLFNP